MGRTLKSLYAWKVLSRSPGLRHFWARRFRDHISRCRGNGRGKTWGSLQRLATLDSASVWPRRWPLQIWPARFVLAKVENWMEMWRFFFSPCQQLTKKVNNIETGWALGATFHLLQSLGISHWGQALPPKPASANNLFKGRQKEERTQSCSELVWVQPRLKPSSWFHQEEEAFEGKSCPWV